MYRKFAILMSLLLAVSCSDIFRDGDDGAAGTVIPDADPLESAMASEDAFRTAIVVFDEEMAAAVEQAPDPIATKSTAWNEIAESAGVISMERIFPDNGYGERTRKAGLHRYYRVRYGGSLTKTGLPHGIRGVSPSRKVKLRATDPLWPYQWALYNDGSRAGYMAGADINVLPVWESYTAGSSSVTVAVVDDGVQLDHPDLAAAAIPAGPEGSRNFCDAPYVIKPSSHATHVAGIIAAVRGNGLGISGVAGGDSEAGISGVRLLNCQIFEGDDLASDDMTAEAIKWAADRGALICQNSWGYYADANDDGVVSDQELRDYKAMTIPDFLRDAIDYFIEYAGCDESGAQKDGSPMKGGVVLFAAGNENIDYDPICAYSPVISVGAFNARGDKAPYSNYGDWVDLAAPGGDFTVDMGIYSLDAGQTYTRLQGTSMACPHASGVAALLVSYFGGPGFTSGELVDKLVGGAAAGVLNTTEIGPKLDAWSSFRYSNPTDDLPPVIEPVGEGPYVFRQWQRAEVKFRVYDPDGHRVTVSLHSEDGSLGHDRQAGICTFVLDCRTVSGFSEKTATITAVDSYGKSTSLTFSYRVVENTPPRAVMAPDGILLQVGGAAVERDFSALFADDDGEPLSLSATVRPESLAHVNLSSDGKLSVTPLSAGRGTVTLQVSDAMGASAQVSVPLVVREKDTGADVWPSRISRYLYVATGGKEAECRVRIYAGGGSLVSEKSGNCSAFTPMEIDMEKAAPGRYTVEVKSGGGSFRCKIVKL